MLRTFVAVVTIMLSSAPPVRGQTPTDLDLSVAELRESIGVWDVRTEVIGPQGEIARVAQGTYDFSWVVPDRVVIGRSESPELGQASGILFYIREAEGEIEMVSVGADGRLWVMTGTLGSDTRRTPEYATADGGRGALRFTRFNVAPDSFESRMEHTEDGGETWLPGNHQVFTRRPPSG
jgi:hypothetical protein